MRLPSILLLAALAAPLAAPAAFAQAAPPGAPDTRRQGENWNMRQDLNANENTTRPSQGQPTDQVRRAQRQAEQQRPITGTGRPVAQMPEPTPGSREVSPTNNARPRPVGPRPTNDVPTIRVVP